MKNITLLISILISSATFSQDASIQWQKTYGGSSFDVMYSAEKTADNGYIFGGYSSSGISGDKTQASNGGNDIWIVKTNQTGVIQWQKTFGGSGEDTCNTVKQTADGGYIVMGMSDSPISGDKTEASRGGLDFWILKLNATGNIIWQKTYGGAQPEFDAFGTQTADGGYYVAGYSDSDISGDKTVPTKGQRDYWALKLDINGAVVWQKAYGGSLVDRITAAFQTTDGGYIMGGYSSSPISGDKTEASRGGFDYWIVKTDNLGVITWQRTFGGSAADNLRDLIQTADGGYLAAGYSLSSISGDKTENSRGNYDYWLVKLNSAGVVTWQRDFGGSVIDYLRDVKQLSDGTYVISGYSNSGVSGDKTDAGNGAYDFWFLKVSTTGTLLSQNAIGGAGDESGPFCITLADGFLLSGSSNSAAGADKAENSRGEEDFWIVKVDASLLGTNKVATTLKNAIFPNPTNGIININLGKMYSHVEVDITNILGQNVKKLKLEQVQEFTTDIVGDSGFYFVAIRTSEGNFETVKIIKN